MDMSTTSSTSTGAGAGINASTDPDSGMEGWKPYLHTSLFSPFSNDPGSGEAFLFPTFRIYSRATFLAACAFTFMLALVERYLSYLLETTFSLDNINNSGSSANSHPNQREKLRTVKRKTSNAYPTNRTAATSMGGVASTGRSVYVNLPTNLNTNTTLQSVRKSRTKLKIKILARNVVYFAATLLRYVLMIIGMGMDWMLLLSVVSGLTLGHLFSDLYTSSSVSSTSADTATRAGTASIDEEVELLHRRSRSSLADEFEIGDDDLDEEQDGCEGEMERKKLCEGEDEGGDYLSGGGGGGGAHRRTSSRQASLSATTPY